MIVYFAIRRKNEFLRSIGYFKWTKSNNYDQHVNETDGYMVSSYNSDGGGCVLVTVTFKRKWNNQLRQIMKITNGGKRGSAQLLQIYSREVGQPYITIVGITLRAVVHALWLMIPVRTQVFKNLRFFAMAPEIVFLCAIALLFKRVRKLFSSLLPYELQIPDQFFVQWSQLQ
ncbi:hypothetical protein NC653_030283 [Populus alba x Populus x berolinensis]|uniref:Uncharacterized protein n=1 Tax=Populus alba x Populus x berolinensis TaxID=444605 RepID=A0AAD6LW58_9ROSI|nr:hypothetical protein NC653_030283 [Populus alba x Populus x berolinensis]